jgi:hypothetical protein
VICCWGDAGRHSPRVRAGSPWATTPRRDRDRRLDLAYLRTEIGLELLDCDISDGLTARQGQLARLDLTGSAVGHHQANEPALNGDALTVTGALSLVGVHAASSSVEGTICLRGCHVGGHLRLPGAIVTNQFGPALHADHLTVDRSAPGHNTRQRYLLAAKHYLRAGHQRRRRHRPNPRLGIRHLIRRWIHRRRS